MKENFHPLFKQPSTVSIFGDVRSGNYESTKRKIIGKMIIENIQTFVEGTLCFLKVTISNRKSWVNETRKIREKGCFCWKLAFVFLLRIFLIGQHETIERERVVFPRKILPTRQVTIYFLSDAVRTQLELFVFRAGYQKSAEVAAAARGNMENRGKLADGKSPIGKA